MARIFINAIVADYSTWRPMFDADVAQRTRAHLRRVGFSREATNPDTLILVWDSEKRAAETRGIVDPMIADRELGALM